MDRDFYGLTPFGATPDEIQLAHLKLGKKAFFHFGVNTFSDNEWGNGQEAEKSFAPTECDVFSWIRQVKDAGFELAILTAKHHDGFCLWQTNYSEHSMKNSPYRDGKGDIVREFTDACRALGVKAGLYVSPWDRHSPYWGTDEYSDYYAKQLEELMTGYGRIDEVWWDGAGSQETEYRWADWAAIIRKHQPHAGIFGSIGATPFVSFRWVGNERGFAGETHFASIDPKYLAVETPPVLNTGVQGGERYIPAEVDVSIRPGWFYHASQDDQVKSPEAIDRIWFDSIGRGAMMLLNFPPDRRGKLFLTDVENATVSHRHITEMLAKDYAKGARIKASSVFCEQTSPENLIGGHEGFYAAKKDDKNPVIDLYLEADSLFNVLILKEKIELGERIHAFTVEAIEQKDGEEEARMLASGSSVGYCKAVFLPEGNYKHLRIRLSGVEAPCLESLSLHRYGYPLFSGCSKTPEDVMKLPGAGAEYSEDRRTVRLYFGGIYTVNILRTFFPGGNTVRLESFDGLSWNEATESPVSGESVQIPFADTACYQLRLTAEKPIPEGTAYWITRT